MTGHATLARLFLAAVKRWPDAEAVRFRHGELWASWTRRDVEHKVAAAAAGLAAIDVRAGDRVALLSENRPEWLLADYATLCCGAITVPVYATLPAKQVVPILADATPRVVLVSTAEQLAKLRSIRAELPSIEHIVCFTPGTASDDVIEWHDLLARGEAVSSDAVAALHEAARAVSPDDVASIIYTSGTTGTPKGVMLTHANLAYMVAATHAHGSLPLQPGDLALSLLPLSHVLERAIEYAYWDGGAVIAYAESIERAPANMRELQPNFLASVPRLFEKTYHRAKGATGLKLRLVNWAERVGGAVADAKLERRPISRGLRARYAIADALVFSKLRSAMGGRMKAFISGGAPLAAEVARFFYAGGLTVYEGYGLTETSPVLAANRPGQTRLGTVGVPYPHVELRIADNGEVLARSPGVMKGYWNRPDEPAVDSDGWFHTGDIGHFDDDGFLWITDRLKDLVVTAGGKNIAPQPIEALASASPYVSQAVLIGDRRPFTVLLATLDWPVVRAWAHAEQLDVHDATSAAMHPRVIELIEHETLGRLRDLASYERPKKVAVLADEFTLDSGLLTPTLKVRRRAVEQRFGSLIDELYQA